MTEPLVTALLDLLRPEIERLVEQLLAERLSRLPPPAPRRWLTTEEAADHMRLSEVALRARARRGRVPAYLDEGRWMYDRLELDDHLRSSDRSAARVIGGHTQNGPAPLERPGPGIERTSSDAY